MINLWTIALRNIVHQVLGSVQCYDLLYVQATKTQYIAEVEICTDKTFNVIACPTSKQSAASMQPMAAFSQEETCRSTEQIAYPTIKPTRN